LQVSDFGLSGKRRASRGPPGTLFWMAPELLRRKGQPSTASDVYSFGITLSEVFNRAEPYAEQVMSMKDVLARVAASSAPGGAPPLRPTLGASVPTAFAILMRRCWHLEAAVRPTMGAINAELRLAADDEETGGGVVTAALQAAKHRHTGEQKLLQSLFPPAVASALAEGRRVEPQEFSCVTVYFSDIVGFTGAWWSGSVRVVRRPRCQLLRHALTASHRLASLLSPRLQTCPPPWRPRR
jgi:serine/threonine protein kinase